MVPIPNQLEPFLKTVPAWAILLVLAAVSLVLIFEGKAVVKVIAFLIVGLIGAAAGGTLAAYYLTSLGNVGPLLGIIIGFIVGGLIGVALVAVGIGLAVGYAVYVLALDFSSATIALIVGAVFFVLAVVLYGKILTLVTALAGGLLLYDVLRYAGLSPAISTILVAPVTLVGIWVNYRPARRATPRG
jgi:hypothetical protein